MTCRSKEIRLLVMMYGISQNTVILPGVQIGDGAIIGTNRFEGGNVASYTIVAGNPTKELRKRFDDEMTQILLEFQ